MILMVLAFLRFHDGVWSLSFGVLRRSDVMLCFFFFVVKP